MHVEKSIQGQYQLQLMIVLILYLKKQNYNGIKFPQEKNVGIEDESNVERGDDDVDSWGTEESFITFLFIA
jgi:hypothetical protein